MDEQKPQRTFLILGGSRGLGRALAEGLPEPGDSVYVASRTEAGTAIGDDGVRRFWIRADLGTDEAPGRIREVLGERALDVFIYNAGIWETGWTDSDFERLPAMELRDIIGTNLTGLVLCAQALLPNLRKSSDGRIVLIGSSCGLENASCGLVGTAASKFGVRGAAHALREVCRDDGIPVTCLSPGTIATDIPLSDGVAAVLERHGRARIPLGDIITLIRAVLRLSPASCVKEIHMPATSDPEL
jgi:NAD(P)-dependent dehydrogenase (short-subunit alcohol dehydrogenase family)